MGLHVHLLEHRSPATEIASPGKNVLSPDLLNGASTDLASYGVVVRSWSKKVVGVRLLPQKGLRVTLLSSQRCKIGEQANGMSTLGHSVNTGHGANKALHPQPVLFKFIVTLGSDPKISRASFL